MILLNRVNEIEALPGVDDLIDTPSENEAWFINGQSFYGGCIAPGDTLDDFEYECNCPKCGLTAIKTEYSKVEGGALNSYNKFKCEHCGHYSDDGAYD